MVLSLLSYYQKENTYKKLQSFSLQHEYVQGQHFELGYSPKNRKRLLLTAIPTLQIPNRVGSCGTFSEKNISVGKIITPDKKRLH